MSAGDRPLTASRTLSSEIFPERVRGISETARIFAGTCRTVVCLRMVEPDPFAQPFIQVDATGQLDEKHNANIVYPRPARRPLPRDLVHGFHRRVDLGSADANAARVQYCIGST